MGKIYFKRGVLANLPTLSSGEPAWVTDEKRLYIGTGSNNVAIATKAEVDPVYAKATIGNTNNYPYHRFAKLDTITSSYADRTTTFLVCQGYSGGGWGIVRLILRTNNTGSVSSVSVQWLLRYGLSANSIQVGLYNVFGSTYADAFYKCPGTYGSTIFRVLESGSRGTISQCWTTVNSQEANDTTTDDSKTSVEVYTSIENAGTALHDQAYTNTISGTDCVSSTVSAANTLATSRTINGTSFNGSANITTANWGTSRTLTVGNTGKSVNGSGNVSWSLLEIGALPLTGGTLTGTLGIKPASGEGGQLDLHASTANTTENGISLDQQGGNFRIFGVASADGTTKTGTGTPLVINPYSKTITGGYTLTGSLSGNAGTATKLATARTISLSGDATGSATFDGSANATISATLANSGVTAGSYGPSANASPEHGGTFSVPYVTVDAKGRVTAASTKTINLPVKTKTAQRLISEDFDLPLLMSYSDNTDTTNIIEAMTCRNNSIYANPSTGKLTATSFAGSGASLTSLNASNLSSGTVAAARLPAATTSALGAVKVGNGLSVSSGVISVSDVFSESQPSGQSTGSYWFEPIDAVNS